MYSVYVIELSRKVFTENAKFRAANPQYNGVLECLYVGSTGKTPQDRFLEHTNARRSKRGSKLHAQIVRKYGLFLRPSLYEHIEPVGTRAEAEALEERLALELRRKRYAVWVGI